MRAARGGMPYSRPRKRWSQAAEDEQQAGSDGSAAGPDGRAHSSDVTATAGTSVAETHESEDALAEAALAESARQRAILAQRLAAVPDSPARSDSMPGSPAGVALGTPHREMHASQMTIQTSSGAVHFDSPARSSEATSTPRRNAGGSDVSASPMDGRLTFAAAGVPMSSGTPSRPHTDGHSTVVYDHRPPPTPVQQSYGITMEDRTELEELQAELHTASREHQVLQDEGYDDYHLVPNALRRQEEQGSPDRAALAAHAEYEEAQRQRQAVEMQDRELKVSKKQELSEMMQRTHLAKVKWLEADTEHQNEVVKTMEAAVAASGKKWEGRLQLEQLKQGAEETAELRHMLEEAEDALDLTKKKYVQNRSFAKAMGAEIESVERFIQEKRAICLELEERLIMVQHEEMVLQAEAGGLCARLPCHTPPAGLPASLPTNIFYADVMRVTYRVWLTQVYACCCRERLVQLQSEREDQIAKGDGHAHVCQLLLSQLGVPEGQVDEETLIDPERRMALIASLVGEQEAMGIMDDTMAQAAEARRERQARMVSESGDRRQ